MSEKSASSSPLEQFVLLAKSAKGAAAVSLIKQVLEAPGVYVFGELLDMPNIQEVYIFSAIIRLYYRKKSETIGLHVSKSSCALCPRVSSFLLAL